MNKIEIVRVVEHYIPNSVLLIYRKSKRNLLWHFQQYLYKKEVKRLKFSNKKINVVFLALFRSSWKYESLMRLMLKDSHFNPIILVCPVINKGLDFMLDTMDETYNSFVTEGLPVIRSYDNATDSYVDITTLAPDILFYSGPYINQIYKGYNHETLRKYLKCYLNYAYAYADHEWEKASVFHSLMWKYFSECEENKVYAQSFGKKYFSNITVTGYPVYDEYVSTVANLKSWKLKDKQLKRIIWAPHHSIEGQTDWIQYSTFLLYATGMLSIAKKYSDRVQFVFKPHPLLRPALYEHPDWGKERTDAYYKKWTEGKNTAFVNGKYMDVFKSSDALIHDCGSFVLEYLYTQKPVMIMLNYDRYSGIGEVGRKALDCHYHGKSLSDIESFIENVVLGGNDPMKQNRELFFNSVLLPPNGCSVAENIVNNIVSSIYNS